MRIYANIPDYCFLTQVLTYKFKSIISADNGTPSKQIISLRNWVVNILWKNLKMFYDFIIIDKWIKKIYIFYINIGEIYNEKNL